MRFAIRSFHGRLLPCFRRTASDETFRDKTSLHACNRSCLAVTGAGLQVLRANNLIHRDLKPQVRIPTYPQNETARRRVIWQWRWGAHQPGVNLFLTYKCVTTQCQWAFPNRAIVETVIRFLDMPCPWRISLHITSDILRWLLCLFAIKIDQVVFFFFLVSFSYAYIWSSEYCIVCFFVLNPYLFFRLTIHTCDIFLKSICFPFRISSCPQRTRLQCSRLRISDSRGEQHELKAHLLFIIAEQICTWEVTKCEDDQFDPSLVWHSHSPPNPVF